ncbi:hypothetical protein D3C81_849500 [compost metagenome]
MRPLRLRRRGSAAQRQRADFRVGPFLWGGRLAVGIEPGNVGDAARRFLVPVGEAVAGERVQPPAQREQAPYHVLQRLRTGRLGLLPVQPRDLVVLAVGVVVAVLGAAPLVAGGQHRRALRQQQRGHQRLRHAAAALQDFRVAGRAFDAAVRAPVGAGVVVGAVAVVLAVGLVVLAVVADQVGQREAVVRGDEVDAGPRAPVAPVEQVGRGRQPRGQFAALAGIAAPEAAHRVAELVVPFGKARRMVAELVPAGAQVPRFRDQLDAAQHRVLHQRIEEARALVEAVALAPERAAQVETEAVHVVALHPVAQRVHHHLQHARVRQVERVAAAGVVDVVAPVARHQAVVAGVVQAAPRYRRPQLVAFAGVVVDHVQDHFDAGRMQAPHRHLAFLQLPGAQVGRFRGEVRHGVVAPVIAQPALQQETVLQDGVHRQQLDGGDAHLHQVVDKARVAQRGEGAAQVGQQVVAQHRQAAHVGFIDDGGGPRHRGRSVVAPVEACVDHHRLGHALGAVAAVRREVAARALQAVAEQHVGPAHRPAQLARVRVQQQLVRVEAVPVRGIVGAVRAVAVQRAERRVGQVAVPDLVGAFRQRQACQFLAAVLGEQAQVEARGMRREHREVDPQPVPVGAQGVRLAGQQPVREGSGHVVAPCSPSAWPGRSTSVASGGSVSASEAGWPCEGTSAAVAMPPLPTLLPP